MSIKLTLLAALAILVPGTTAQVQTKKPAAPVIKSWMKEPDSFRDTKFLSSEAEVRSKFEFEACVVDVDDPQGQVCPFNFRLADVDIDGVLTFFRGAFVGVRAIFEPDDFPTVRSVFVERFGEPLAAAGVWTGKSVSIELTQSVPVEFKRVVIFAAAHRQKALYDAAFARFTRSSGSDMRQWKSKRDLALRLYQIYSDQHRDESETDTADREYEQDKAKTDREYEKDTADANAKVEKFKSASHSGFSITVNEYVAEAAKRKAEERKKGAGVL